MLGALYAIVGGINLITAVVLLAGTGALAVLSGDARTAVDTMTSEPAMMIASFSLLAGPLNLIGGIGLLKKRSWAWGLVLGLSMHEFTELPNRHASGRVRALGTDEIRSASVSGRR